MSKISPAAAIVKPTPPRAIRVSMSKPTHQPQGYAWLMFAMVAMPVANRTIVATMAARSRPQRSSKAGRHHPGRSAVCMVLGSVLIVSPEAEAPLDDHRDDRHRHPHRPEDLGREVQHLHREDRRRFVRQVGRVAELLEGDGGKVQDGGAADLVEAVDVVHVVIRGARDAAPSFLHHVVPLTERDGPGRTHLGARGLAADLDAIGTERALVDGGHDAVEVELRDDEGAGLHAVPAPDAAPGVEDHRPLGGLRERGGRTRRGARGLETVHAQEAAEHPVGASLRARLNARERDHRVVVRVEVAPVLIARPGEEAADIPRQVIPGLAGHHAGPTPDAPGVVLDHRLERHQAAPFRLTLHRNALNSGIIVLASPTCGVRRLPLSPCERPTQPQCHGTPTWWTIRPCTQNGSKRCVTRAYASNRPRALSTTTRSQLAIPFSRAGSTPISTKASGMSPTSQGIFRLMAPVCQCSETR